MHRRAADPRHTADNRGSNAETPVGVLVEAHHLAGERHAKCEEQKPDADDPGKLPREFISSEEEYLHHMEEDDGDHEVRAPTVQRADVPAKSDVVIQELKAPPRLAGGWAVNQRQQNAGHHLHDKENGGGASKDIPPARIVRGCGVRGCLDHRLDETEAMLDPLVGLESGFDAALLQTCHGVDLFPAAAGSIWMRGFSLQEAWVASVGMSPAWIINESPSSLYLYSNKPRSGGPEALAPSS